MKIEIEVNADKLIEAINRLSDAVEKGNTPLTGMDMSVEAGAAVEPEPKAKRLSPSDQKKLDINTQIESLGGEAVTSGSVAKYQKALDELKAEQATKGDDDEPTGDFPIDDNGDSIYDADDAPSADATVEEVTTLARAIVKIDPDDAKAGLAKLGGCLLKVGAKRVTEATQEQLNELAPMMQKVLDKN